MKKLILLLLFIPLVSFGQDYTIKRNVDGSINISDDKNPLKSLTMRKQVDGSYKTIDNSNALSSYTLKRQVDGSFKFSSDSNPLNSYTIKRNIDNSYTTINDRDIFDSKTTRQNVDGSSTTRNDFNFFDSSTATQNINGTISVKKNPNYSTPNIQPVIIPNNNSANSGSYANPNGYSSKGAYQNPKIIKQSNQAAVGNAISQAGVNISTALIQRMARLKKNEVSVPLQINPEAFKFFIIKSNEGGKQIGKAVKKRIKKYLIPLGYNVVDITSTSKDLIPDNLENNKSENLYITIWAKDNFNGVQVKLSLLDFENNLVYEKLTVDMSASSATKKVLSEFISQPHIYNANAQKYKILEIPETQIISKKDNAVNELKKLKELLDLELITQEEFDIKSKELKKIILGN